MTQFLPANFDFDEGITALGTYLLEYIPALPDVTAYAISSMHDGYQGYSGQGGFQLTNSAATSIGSATQGCPFINKRIYAVDTAVTVNFRFLPVAGTFTTSNIVELGVLQRVNAGTIVNDGNISVYNRQPSCYRFQLTQSGGLGSETLHWKVDKIVGGTVTNISTANVTASTVITGASNLLAPVEFKMTVQDSGPNVTIDCEVNGWGNFSAYDPFGGTVTDSVSPLTPTDYRVGFTTGRDRAIVSPNTVDVVDLVQSLQV
ncbi:MAG: hypothetical protein R3344_12435, partial [Acidobacteriota bacterium]|nr:hypothetical protein [Acidobacteriota bacterium]